MTQVTPEETPLLFEVMMLVIELISIILKLFLDLFLILSVKDVCWVKKELAMAVVPLYRGKGEARL